MPNYFSKKNFGKAIGYLPIMPVNARDSPGTSRDMQGLSRDKQGQGRDKQGERKIPFLSLLVPTCPCLSLLVHACPCFSLCVPVCPSLSFSFPVCPNISLHLLHLHVFMSSSVRRYYIDFPCKSHCSNAYKHVFNFFFIFHLASSIIITISSDKYIFF